MVVNKRAYVSKYGSFRRSLLFQKVDIHYRIRRICSVSTHTLFDFLQGLRCPYSARKQYSFLLCSIR